MRTPQQGWSGPVVVGLLLALLAVPRLLFGTGVVTPGSSQTPAAGGCETAESASWPADAVLYHVFVDRFANGDAPSTQVPGTPDDPGYAAALTDWMGGDLAGLEARLDHLVATGANTLELSPVNRGPAFHGYHPTDPLNVDPRFGTVEQHPWLVEARSDGDGSTLVAWYRFTACPGS